MALALVLSVAFGDFGHVLKYALIITFFITVVGGGFNLVPSRWMELDPKASPGWAVLRFQATWIALALLLLLAAFGLLRWGVGAAAFGGFGIAVTILVSLLCTSLAAGWHTGMALVKRTRDLERSRARAGYLALQAQLQPHTFFNALNTILAQVQADPQGAEASIRSLAKLLRRTMEALDQETWTLKEECEVIRALLSLERARFGDRLSFEVALEAEAEGTTLPPLLLLPLVENSLKHGFRGKVGTCRLDVRASAHRVEVADDGLGRQPGAREGVGLRTVRQRLEAWGGTLSWPSPASGCVVRVELP